jgi:hypothetical protein
MYHGKRDARLQPEFGPDLDFGGDWRVGISTLLTHLLQIYDPAHAEYPLTFISLQSHLQGGCTAYDCTWEHTLSCTIVAHNGVPHRLHIDLVASQCVTIVALGNWLHTTLWHLSIMTQTRQADTTQPDRRWPDMRHSHTRQPGSRQPGRTQPDTRQANTRQSDTRQPAKRKPDRRQPRRKRLLSFDDH